MGVISVRETTDVESIRKNCSVYLREDGTVRRVIEKPLRVDNNLQGCGMYFFDAPIFEAIRRTPRTAMRDEYELIDSIQILVDYDYPVRVARVIEWEINVTHIRDLIVCCSRELHNRGETCLVGAGCSIADGTQLVDTVVGENVTIRQPARLERCVVMPNVVLDGGDTFVDTVITQDAKLHAKYS